MINKIIAIVILSSTFTNIGVPTTLAGSVSVVRERVSVQANSARDIAMNCDRGEPIGLMIPEQSIYGQIFDRSGKLAQIRLFQTATQGGSNVSIELICH